MKKFLGSLVGVINVHVGVECDIHDTCSWLVYHVSLVDGSCHTFSF